jgi:hypothetical protein
MNTEEARVKTSARQGRGDGDDERGVKPARDGNLPRRSVEILRDLGLSKEKIVAYLECAPAGRQIERLDLTMPVGLPEDGSHDQASIAQRGVQAAGC